MYALKTHNITKKYGSAFAVDKVNISVKKGAILGIIGENGAGKSTTLKIITKAIYPTSGSFEVFEGESGTYSPRIGGYVDVPRFYETLSAKENVEVIRRISGKQKCYEAKEVLETVGLADAANKRVGKFSLGMKQRLALAMALVTNPDIVILDEPLNGLDPAGIQDFRKLVKSLSETKKITFIISSHLLLELEKIATDYVIMQKGKVIADFSETELKKQLHNYIDFSTDDVAKVKEILETVVDKNKIKTTDNKVTVVCTVEKYSELISKVGSYCYDISIEKQDLESYYKQLIQR